MIEDNNNLRKPLLSIFPSSWKDSMGIYDNLEFRNLDHFKHTVSKLKQKDDSICGITYKDAVEKLLSGKTDISSEKTAEIKNLAKSNLFKRGLITQEIYENFKYTVDGTKVDVDVAKYAAGEADCVMTPSVEYVDFFYELYISVSYSFSTSNEFIIENVIKLLSTIEELERQHIFIKITLLLPCTDLCNDRDTNFFSSIPLFSHNQTKTVELMSSVVNERLLRKFYFAILENVYGESLKGSYGTVKQLEGCMNIGNEFNEIDFFNLVKTSVGA